MARLCLDSLTRIDGVDFEIIVSDNSSSATDKKELSEACARSGGERITYVSPETELNMVDHWNFAYRYVRGEYVVYLTDRTVMMPGTLEALQRVIGGPAPDIITWNTYAYYPRGECDGPGTFSPSAGRLAQSRLEGEGRWFDPREELRRKALGATRRHEDDSLHYARGKICFGAFRRELCNRISALNGVLFSPISPDYTSMILGLYLAEDAFELNCPGIVQVFDQSSNGNHVMNSDAGATQFLSTFGPVHDVLRCALLPEVTGSMNNIVVCDYVTLKERLNLDYHVDLVNWLVYIWEDVRAKTRANTWSSKEVAEVQIGALEAAIQRLSRNSRRRFKTATRQVISDERFALRTQKRQQARTKIERFGFRLLALFLPRVVAQKVRTTYIRRGGRPTESAEPFVLQSPSECIGYLEPQE